MPAVDKKRVKSPSPKEMERISALCLEAVDALKEVFEEIVKGAVPSAEPLLERVRALARAASKDPASLLQLAPTGPGDGYTFQHSVSVGVLALALAASLGHDVEQVAECGLAGFLHDIGKTRVDLCILDKPGELSRDEVLEIRKHPEYGAEIVRGMTGVPPGVIEAVLGHHVRFDRTGYPESARTLCLGVPCAVVAVADFYDATTTLRAYQRPMLRGEAIEALRRARGTVLDGSIVEGFLELTDGGV
ncbi:HD-GYP domain-containing protein [Geomonas subterranea]|uniref:HD-GYP domain-containing protein n=1 Tax=Geomonas subterranea TaxID=2847989 RepID=UPI001CD62141|nr:HD domain-containing phosphohydrolase [Geomonas fuzhouensis]